MLVSPEPEGTATGFCGPCFWAHGKYTVLVQAGVWVSWRALLLFPGQLKDVPTHTQCGHRERGARASWHVWAGEASLLIPRGCIIAALHVESFKFVDKIQI